MITVTIILTSIGRNNFLQETFKSIEKQTIEPDELIFSENFVESPFNGKIPEVKSYKYMNQSTRLSMVDHFNLCIESVTSDIFFFLCDDDLIDSNYIEKLKEAFSKNSIEAAIGKNSLIDVNGNFLHKERNFEAEYSPKEAIFKWLVPKNKFPVRTFISLAARTKTFVGKKFPDYPHGAHMDNWFFSFLMKKGNLKIINSNFLYRIYPESVGLSMRHVDLINSSIKFQEDFKKLGYGSFYRLILKIRNLILLYKRIIFRSEENKIKLFFSSLKILFN